MNFHTQLIITNAQIKILESQLDEKKLEILLIWFNENFREESENLSKAQQFEYIQHVVLFSNQYRIFSIENISKMIYYDSKFSIISKSSHEDYLMQILNNSKLVEFQKLSKIREYILTK